MMTHWKKVPGNLQARLEEIAEVLDEARRVRHTFDQLGTVAQGSRAALEINWAKSTYKNDSIAMRVHRVVVLWGVMAAEMLAGIAALCRQSEVIIAPMPLTRSVLEYCSRIVWILDHRSHVSPQTRFARVLLDELLSAEEACKAASHLGGRGSPAHRATREERSDVRREAQLVDSHAIVTGSPREWVIAGERLLSPTDSAANFGEMWGDARLSEGIYDVLSAYSHPTLVAMDFYEVVDGHPVLTTERDAIEKFISHAIIPYYQALRHHLAYNGWKSREFDAWEAHVQAVFPGIIV